MKSRDMLSLDTPASGSAPHEIRRWLAASARLGSIGAMELSIVGSELVTNIVESIDSRDRPEEYLIKVALQDVLGAVKLDVRWEVVERPIDLHPWSRAVLTRYAERWGRQRDDVWDEVWVEFRRPGGSSAIESATDEEVLARAALSDPHARAEVYRRWSPMAGQIARRYRHAGVELSDLEQVAYLAMMKAVDRYDPDAGAFENYAAATISGELKRHLRDKAWAVRVPRPLKNTAIQVTRMRREMTQRLGRSPTLEEIADELGIPAGQVREAEGAGATFWSRSLDAPIDLDEGVSLGDLIGEEDANLDLAEHWHALAKVTEYLSDRDKELLRLRFVEELTQRQIGDRLGISQMQVSRCLAQVIEKIRTFFP